jgi:hypothetical protein
MPCLYPQNATAGGINEYSSVAGIGDFLGDLLETHFRVWGFLSLRLVYTSQPSGGAFLEDRPYIRSFLDLWRQKCDCRDMPLRQLGVANGASCEYTPVVWES